MSQFKNHYRLASRARLAPGCNESVGKKKSVKISRTGFYLKQLLSLGLTTEDINKLISHNAFLDS